VSIRDLPKMQQLQEQIDQLRQMGSLLPFLKKIGNDVEKTGQGSQQIDELQLQFDEMVETFDRFNFLFSDIGWILFDSAKLSVAKQAIEIAETHSLDVADDFLVDYYSSDWVNSHLIYFKYIRSFKPRFSWIERAAKDYEEGRYYASVFVVLAMIDGWVNDLNIVGNSRYGFFSEVTDMTAYNSTTAYQGGLAKLHELLMKSRKKTRTEEIHIPYRNGIVHGTDLGFDNKKVTAKCWALLFSVREWALLAERGEINPPSPEPEEETTLLESYLRYRKTLNDGKRLEEWKPRKIIVGEDVPVKGDMDDYPVNSPERKLVEFLLLWEKRNYGGMSKFFTPMFSMSPKSINFDYSPYLLLSWEIEEISDITPTETGIQVKVYVRNEDQEKEIRYQYRIVCSDQDGKLAFLPKSNTIWGLAARTLIK
jgi:hypothetical protein